MALGCVQEVSPLSISVQKLRVVSMTMFILNVSQKQQLRLSNIIFFLQQTTLTTFFACIPHVAGGSFDGRLLIHLLGSR